LRRIPRSSIACAEFHAPERLRCIQRKTDAALYSAQSQSCAEFSATVNLRFIPRKVKDASNHAQIRQ
jgi:hypothetical protein